MKRQHPESSAAYGGHPYDRVAPTPLPEGVCEGRAAEFWRPSPPGVPPRARHTFTGARPTALGYSVLGFSQSFVFSLLFSVGSFHCPVLHLGEPSFVCVQSTMSPCEADPISVTVSLCIAVLVSLAFLFHFALEVPSPCSHGPCNQRMRPLSIV